MGFIRAVILILLGGVVLTTLLFAGALAFGLVALLAGILYIYVFFRKKWIIHQMGAAGRRAEKQHYEATKQDESGSSYEVIDVEYEIIDDRKGKDSKK